MIFKYSTFKGLLVSVLTVLFMVSIGVDASEDNYAFTDPKQRQVFLNLTAELRCPMCQNQNIADSDAMIAHDMRRKVYELMQQGYTEREIIDFMRARYGDFVHYQPPVTPATSMLWFVPLGFVLVGGLAFVFRRFYSSARNTSELSETQVEQDLAQAEKLLEQEK